MTRSKLIIISFSVLLLSLLIVVPVTAEPRNIVVGNTKEWQSLYLASMYAGLTDAEIIFFKNLGDSQIKSRTIGKDDNIIILESNKKPVVKNYESFLRVNGYKNFKTISFDGYEDLQEFLFDDVDTNGVFVTNSQFGIDAVSATPLIIKERYKPIFITENNLDYVKKNVKPGKTIISGYIPVRWVSGLAGEKIIGYPFETNKELTDLVVERNPNQWGSITKIDTIDLESIKQGIPVFVFYGTSYLDVVANSIKKSGIKNFEVIGAGTSDIAKALETGAGENLNMLLKYGRTITNVPGLEGKILDIDAVKFGFPVENLKIEKVTYYPNLETLGITFTNEGNIDLMLYTNAEYASSAVSDEFPHQILVGQTKTIPFPLADVTGGTDAIITTRYGYDFPFRNGISDKDGNPIFRTNVETDSHSETPTLEFRSSSYDH